MKISLIYIIVVCLNFRKCLLTNDPNSGGDISDESVNEEIANEIKNMTSREAELFVQSFKRGYKRGKQHVLSEGFQKGFDAGMNEAKNEPDFICGLKHLSSVIRGGYQAVIWFGEGKSSLDHDLRMSKVIERILPSKTLDNKSIPTEKEMWLQSCRNGAMEIAKKWKFYLEKYDNGGGPLWSGLNYFIFLDNTTDMPVFCGTVAASEKMFNNILNSIPCMSETNLEKFFQLQNRMERHHNSTKAAVYESSEFKEILLNEYQYRLLMEDFIWLRRLRSALKLTRSLPDRHSAYNLWSHTIGKDEKGREIVIPLYDKLSGCSWGF